MKKFIIITLLVLGLASTGFAGSDSAKWKLQVNIDAMTDAKTIKARVMDKKEHAMFSIACTPEKELIFGFADGDQNYGDETPIQIRVDKDTVKTYDTKSSGHWTFIFDEETILPVINKLMSGSEVKVASEGITGRTKVRVFTLKNAGVTIGEVLKACGK